MSKYGFLVICRCRSCPVGGSICLVCARLGTRAAPCAAKLMAPTVCSRPELPPPALFSTFWSTETWKAVTRPGRLAALAYCTQRRHSGQRSVSQGEALACCQNVPLLSIADNMKRAGPQKSGLISVVFCHAHIPFVSIGLGSATISTAPYNNLSWIWKSRQAPVLNKVLYMTCQCMVADSLYDSAIGYLEALLIGLCSGCYHG